MRRLKDPALMEYAGQGVLKVRIFPIEPRSEKRVRLRYTQLLVSDGGLVEYLYPLNTEKYSAAPLETVTVKVDIESRRPLAAVYSPSHEVEIRRSDSNHAVVGFEAADVTPATDFRLFYSEAAAKPIWH